ncbi:MAG: hypothetical protein U0359_24515 [Byssovorax sp.]
MTMIPRDNTETSVTFSLAELARLEEQRVHEEEQRRHRAREKEARDRREAEERRRAQEAAEIAAETEARARKRREQAEIEAREEARRQAEAQVARIAAEAKVKLDAENAARAHELAVLRVKTEAGRSRVQLGLAIALGLSLLAGGGLHVRAEQALAEVSARAERLEDGRATLTRERDQAKSAELASLDKRFGSLKARLGAEQNEAALITAEQARAAIDPAALDRTRMRAFGDALDALQGKVDARDELARLDQRRGDLDAWAAQQKKRGLLGDADEAAARARATFDAVALATYKRALDQASRELAHGTSAAGSAGPIATARVPEGKPCLKGDPGCGLDGKRIF